MDTDANDSAPCSASGSAPRSIQSRTEPETYSKPSKKRPILKSTAHEAAQERR